MVVGISMVRAGDHRPLKAQQWLSDDKSAQLEILSRPYARAPSNFASKEEEITYQIGEALFRSPILLGGQAAKAQLSCNSCHLSGADNPEFQFPNISGAPGTADVSSSFFSSFRGNRNFDPIAIPDLRKMGKIPINDKAQLSAFIRGLIVEEFNGHEPPAQALDAVTFYVQRVKYSHIPPAAKLSVRDPITIINQSVDNIIHSLKNNNEEVANLLIDAARHQLGLIYERYKDPNLQAMIIMSSNNLAKIKNDWKMEANVNILFNDPIGSNSPILYPDTEISLRSWRTDFMQLSVSLIKNEKKSLFHEPLLRKEIEL